MKDSLSLRLRIMIVGCVLCFGISSAWADTVDLMDLQRRTDSILEWDPWSQMGLLTSRAHTVAFRVGLPFAVIDYDQRIDIGPVTRQGASIQFTEDGAKLIMALLDPPRPAKGEQRVAAIMIDPGHGGKDPGTVHQHRINGHTIDVMEKHIVLDVSRQLYSLLKHRFPGTRVFLTRDDDTFVVLEERPRMANAALPDGTDVMLFISVHANAATRKQPSGFEVWVLPKEHERNLISSQVSSHHDSNTQPILNAMMDEQISRESVVLANQILDGLDARVGDRTKNRGLFEESWAVVRHARMPAVLVELGFVTNPSEARLLTQPAYLSNLARGIYDGVSGFISWFESSRSQVRQTGELTQ